MTSLLRRGRLQRVEQAIDQVRRVDDGAEQDEALARVVVTCELAQRTGKLAIAGEALGAGAEPLVERRFSRPHVGRQLDVKSGRIADQVSGMDLEEAGEQLPGVMREVRARA